MKTMTKKNNLWWKVEPKEVVKGVWGWENCLEVPEGIIDIMNSEVFFDTIFLKMNFAFPDKTRNFSTLLL